MEKTMPFNFIKLLFSVMILTTSLITYAKSHESNQVAVNSAYNIRYPNQVKQLLSQINPQEMWKNLTVLTTFPDRSCKSQSGVDAALWIKKSVEELAMKSGRDDVKVFTIETKGINWGKYEPFSSDQPSVILQIGNSSNPGIVVGAHLDTIAKCTANYCDDKRDIAGADDDGSGSVAVLEIARTLLASGMHFNKPIYLIWYAGEEAGSWGAQSVIADFQKRNISVSAVMQLDQIGYARKNDLMMYFESDIDVRPGDHSHVDKELTLFTKKLLEQYVGRPVELSCHGSSDEEAWTDLAHVKAVRPLESDYCELDNTYPYTHSSEDTMDKLSLTHMTDYLKLGLSFVVEMAEPIQS